VFYRSVCSLATVFSQDSSDTGQYSATVRFTKRQEVNGIIIFVSLDKFSN
jgi:hypothetical protein